MRCKKQHASCNPKLEIYNLQFFTGVLAQLVERLNGIEEVTGSNPVGSKAVGVEPKSNKRASVSDALAGA